MLITRNISEEDLYTMFLNKDDKFHRYINKNNIQHHIKHAFWIRDNDYIKYLFENFVDKLEEEHLKFARYNIEILRFFLKKYGKHEILSFKELIQRSLIKVTVSYIFLDFLTEDVKCDVSKLLKDMIFHTCNIQQIVALNEDHPLFEDERYSKLLIKHGKNIVRECIDKNKINIIKKIIDVIDKKEECNFLLTCISNRNHELAELFISKDLGFSSLCMKRLNNNVFKMNEEVIKSIIEYGFRLNVGSRIDYCDSKDHVTKEKLILLSSLENFDDYIEMNKFLLLKYSRNIETTEYIISLLN